MIISSLIEKAISCVIAFVSDELSKIYNTLLAVFGLLSVVLTPIAAVCFLPDSLIFAVIATTAGVMTGTVILMSGYAKILKNRVVEIKEKFDADVENLCIEVKRLRDFDSARSDTIINSISASPVNITLHEKLDYNVCKYFKDDIQEPKTIIPVVFHRPSRSFFHGLYSCVGTRYFGGILLGTGGLVRAYTAAASGALQSAELVSMRLVVDCKVRVSYAQFEQAQRIIAAAETRLDEPIFDDAVTLCWRMPAGREETLRTALNELTRGGAEVEISAPQYAAF